jgi:RNA polymerase sigma-70 factor (ECF subfamily)
VSAFGTTVWTVVERAGRDSQSAIAEIFRSYRPPVVRYLRSHGVDEHVSEDLAQEVFKRLFVDGVLKRADPKLGKFRGLVLAVSRRVLSEDIRRRNALKRKEVPLPPPERAEVFDRMWLENLLEKAVDRLRAKSREGKVPYAEALELHVKDGLPYAEIGRRLRCAEGVARNWVHRARGFVAGQVRELVREYASSKEDFESEMRYLAKYLP